MIVTHIFFGRLLPGVRSLISLPAGAARTPFFMFSVMTLAGSFVWSLVLAWFVLSLLTGIILAVWQARLAAGEV